MELLYKVKGVKEVKAYSVKGVRDCVKCKDLVYRGESECTNIE